MKQCVRGIAVAITAVTAMSALSVFVGCKPQSILAVKPNEGVEVMLANDQVADFVANYELGISKYYKTGNDIYEMKKLTLEWEAKKAFNSYMVAVSTQSDMSDPILLETKNCKISVSDLYVATNYYWQVTGVGEDGEEASQVFTFQTAQSPRTIYIEGVSNTRDVGGYVAADGRRVKQGMAFRAATLDTVTQRGRLTAMQTYAIKTDLDLRRPAEGTAGGSSPLGNVKYINISSPYYLGGDTGIDVAKNYEAVAGIMRTFADKSNYPILYHCSVGRDRTGMVSMLLLGLLGVEYQDIALDYELSFFSERGTVDGADVEMMMRQFKAAYQYVLSCLPGASFQESCEAYLMMCGLTEAEIAAIRENMLQ